MLQSTGAGDIRSVCYLRLGEEELILFGTKDGSILIVDSRTASILLLCRRVLNYPIAAILHSDGVLVLVGESNSVTSYELGEGSVRELVAILDAQAAGTLTTDSQICSYSNLQAVSKDGLGMLVMSKFGVLWLLDVTGRDTIKISSVHTRVDPSYSTQPTITKCINAVVSGSGGRDTIISGGRDGTVKVTTLDNL